MVKHLKDQALVKNWPNKPVPEWPWQPSTIYPSHLASCVIRKLEKMETDMTLTKTILFRVRNIEFVCWNFAFSFQHSYFMLISSKSCPWLVMMQVLFKFWPSALIGGIDLRIHYFQHVFKFQFINLLESHNCIKSLSCFTIRCLNFLWIVCQRTSGG